MEPNEVNFARLGSRIVALEDLVWLSCFVLRCFFALSGVVIADYRCHQPRAGGWRMAGARCLSSTSLCPGHRADEPRQAAAEAAICHRRQRLLQSYCHSSGHRPIGGSFLSLHQTRQGLG
nr:hypothetical protein CFP56_11214 [Quercus suber]